MAGKSSHKKLRTKLIDVTINNSILIPIDKINVNLSKELSRIANVVVIPGLVSLIVNRKSFDGTNLPELEPATIEAKGHDWPLIDKRLLISSFRAKKAAENIVVIDIQSRRAEIAKHLQVDGVGYKKKKFKFFGISKEMNRDCIRMMYDMVKQTIRNA